jgi:hypothetical protein
MKSERTSGSAPRGARHLEFEYDTIDDPYQLRQKLSEPTVCPDCGAVYQDGRWQWLLAPARSEQARCTACLRIQEENPAGFITVHGPFLEQHRDEITHLMQHIESRQKKEHPMQRIMSLGPDNGKLLVTVTDIHLARAIGEALQHAYKGDLKFHYNKGEYLLRVDWQH